MAVGKKSTHKNAARSRHLIKQAFAELLNEKDMSKITVTDIVERANISRGTFYAHYLDVYDLYDKLEQDILIEWGMLVLKLQELRTEEFFRRLVDYVDRNRLLFRMVFTDCAA